MLGPGAAAAAGIRAEGAEHGGPSAASHGCSRTESHRQAARLCWSIQNFLCVRRLPVQKYKKKLQQKSLRQRCPPASCDCVLGRLGRCFPAHAAKCGCATAAPPLAQVLRPPSQRRPRGRTCSLVCPAPANQQAPGTSQRPRTSRVRVRATRPDCRMPPTTHTHTQAQGSGRQAPCERQLMADPVPWRLALGRAAPAVAREVLLASVAATEASLQGCGLRPPRSAAREPLAS